MWYELFKFEIKYRIRRADTYVFFAFILLFSLVGVDFVFQGVDLGGVKKNAPLVIAKSMGAITGILMIITSLVMGVPVLRDFQYNIESILYTNPISKRDYLVGRYLGSLTILLVLFFGLPLGMALGEFLPWHQSDDLSPFSFAPYLQTYLLIVLPILFFGACLFFVSGSLSKKLLVVYTQGVLFFVLFILVNAITNENLQAILDPFSLSTISEITESWNVAMKNSEMISFTGLLLYNKLLWLLFGLIILLIGYYKFNFNIVSSRSYKKGKSKKISENNFTEDSHFKLSKPKIRGGLQAQWIQLISSAKFYCKAILKETFFWAIIICGVVIILINSISLGTVHDVDSYPATYFLVEELQEMAIYFFIIILVFYSAELIWKERSVKIDLICDSTPTSNIINIGGKYLALLFIYMIVILSLILSGIIFQSSKGYYNFQLDVYFYGFFLEILPFLALYTMVAFFFQVLINRKFVAIIAVLLFFLMNLSLEFFGFKHDLYKFGGSPLFTYSEMNEYGHFLSPYLWIKAYWLVFGSILLVLASMIMIRGTETNLIKRLKIGMRQKSKPLRQFGLSALFILVCFGGYIFYNTNIINEYWTDDEARAFRIGYEKSLKGFEYKKQPKIIDAKVKVELYPENRDYVIEGSYLLKNNHDEPINQIHVQKYIESNLKLNHISFGDNSKVNLQFEEYDHYIYELSTPLQPNDSIRMEFMQTYTTQGFEEEDSNTSIVYNGTFFRNTQFPTIGYNSKYEISDNDTRKSEGLLPLRLKADRNDIRELVNSRTGSDSHGINLEVIIGTSSDQIAVAPGNLIGRWKKDNRNYFHYKTENQIIDFYSMVSARYEVMEDKWSSGNKEVSLEIYYHKPHTYNLKRMMKSMKKSLNYFNSEFSPYQYSHLRIMEIPRYAQFAQSFPGTIPFSESLGFVLDIDDGVDVDMVFFITAHEVAHQWWGMQVEAANVQGKNMVLETLAQYSALMVLKENYSEGKVKQFLQYQIDEYNEAKVNEGDKEIPLALVENQDYIYYNKGVIAMYLLQEKIGEKTVNQALQNFIKKWNSYDGYLRLETKRYATTKDLLKSFMEITPESKHTWIYDLFESAESNGAIHQFEKEYLTE